jgi:ABC-type xylose transport system substrate-binding protein
VTTKGRPKELAYLISPIQLTKANWRKVITSGYYKKSEICNGEFAQYC